MLCSAKGLIGKRVQTRDDVLATVHDLYFDDLNWVLRYLVVETGEWLDNRRVLLAPSTVRNACQEEVLVVDLEREQIAQSPAMEEEQPISRQYERSLHEHYNWPLYWTSLSAAGFGTAGVYPTAPATIPAEEEGRDEEETETRHLRSVQEIIDYDVEASGGSVGHIDDFIVNDENWAIFYMVIDTSRWLRPGKHVLLAPTWVEEIDWHGGDVRVDVDKGLIRKSPEFNLEQMIDREYETRLYEHYGRPRYW